MIATIQGIRDLQREFQIPDKTLLNFVVTDGTLLVATRYSSEEGSAATLYYTFGRSFECIEGGCQIVGSEEKQFVMIASEPLTDNREEWTSIPVNHLVSVSDNYAITQNKISLTFVGALFFF